MIIDFLEDFENIYDVSFKAFKVRNVLPYYNLIYYEISLLSSVLGSFGKHGLLNFISKSNKILQ